MVEENQVLAVIEAMKMETSVVARMAGTVDKIPVTEGTSVKAGELLITIQYEKEESGPQCGPLFSVLSGQPPRAPAINCS